MNSTNSGLYRTSIFAKKSELTSCLFRSFPAIFNNQSVTFYNFQNCARPFSKLEVTKYCKKLGMKVPVPKTLADVEFIQNANCLYGAQATGKLNNNCEIIDVSTVY